MTNQPELLPETAGDFYTRMDCDGRKWAKELSDTFPSIPMEDAIGWCANMIMQGYDRGYANAKREDNPSWPITPSPATHTQGEDASGWAANTIAAIEAWKRGDDDGGGVIAKCESYAKAALSAMPVPAMGEEAEMWKAEAARLSDLVAALSMQPNTAEAHGDVVAALERARNEACSCNGTMGRCIIHECYDDCISVVKAALHQPTEDEAVEALLAKFEKEEPFGDGLEMITSTKGELHTVFDIYCRGYRAARTQVNITEREAVEIIRKAIWNVYDGENTDLELAQAAYRALNRPVGGEK